MYIVWRQRPVTSNHKAELFSHYTECGVQYDQGNLKRGRHKDSYLDGPAWKPLWCEHRGSGRVAWTPLVMHAERVDGRPRQKLLHRLPTIRSCCIKDQFIRAAWWHDVEDWMRFAAANHGSMESQFIARDRRAILAKLCEVVLPPTKAGLRDFTAYRLEKEAEVKRYFEEYRESVRRQLEEQRQEQ